MAWTPEQYLEAWRREKRRERGGKKGKNSFTEEETVIEGDEEEEELIHVVADGEQQMRRKLCLGKEEEEGGRGGEVERGNRVRVEEGGGCTEGVGDGRRGGRRVDSEVSRQSRCLRHKQHQFSSVVTCQASLLKKIFLRVLSDAWHQLLSKAMEGTKKVSSAAKKCSKTKHENPTLFSKSI